MAISCYNSGMPSRTILIPTEQQQVHTCASCQSELRFAILPKLFPHLYCARCNNVYVEPSSAKKVTSIWWPHLAKREQHEIQSHGPVCACGGLFLFNATPHCAHCGRALPFALPTNAKQRLCYDQLIVFNDTKVYLDAGTVDTYQFA
jgi:hypothetical protein